MFFRVALTSVRLLRASLLCGLVGLGGCDALWGALGRDNPQNCAQPSSTCGSDEVCDTQAQICVSGLALRDVQPWRASTGGGVPITLRGEHFLPGAIVTVDGQPAADVLVRSDSELSFTLPAGQSGAWVVPIAVQNPTGHRAERRDLFAYFSDTPQFSDASFPFGGSPVGMVTGDWNSDTFTDLAFIGVPFTGVPLWPGDGNGGFALSTSLSVGTPAFPPQSIAVLDANRDGKADLAVSAGASISVLTADGRGDFPTRRSVYTGTSVERLAAGDVDGDGLADLLVSDKPATGPSNILLLRGAADGSFANSGIVDTGSYPCALAIADLTGDGVRDLLVGYEDGALHLVRRDVGGSPTLVDIAIPSCQLQNFALADA